MADYNTYTNMPPQCVGTELVPRTGMRVRKASNGAPRKRALQSADKIDVKIAHVLMSQTQRNALVAFYTANRTTTFTFTADEDGIQRNCMFDDPPYRIVPVRGKARFNATVFLLEA